MAEETHRAIDLQDVLSALPTPPATITVVCPAARSRDEAVWGVELSDEGGQEVARLLITTSPDRTNALAVIDCRLIAAGLPRVTNWSVADPEPDGRPRVWAKL